MVRMLLQNWWAVALRGVVAVLFGIMALALPALTVTTLVILFGAFALVDGVFALCALIFGKRRSQLVVQLVEALISILAGLVALAMPGLTALAFLFVIAAWAVLSGIFQVVMAVRLRKAIDNEWLLALGGVLSVILGIVFFARPGVGVLSLAWLLGVYAVVFGIVLVALGFRLRGLRGRLQGRLEELDGGPGTLGSSRQPPTTGSGGGGR